MTESDWLILTAPDAMLDFLTNGSVPVRAACPCPPPSARKLRLFACACCRQVWHLLTDERSRRAVEVSERYADEGEAVAKAMGRAWLYLDMESPHGDAWVTAYLTCAPPDTLARDLVQHNEAVSRIVPPATQAALLRCIMGNPWRPVYLSRIGEQYTEEMTTFGPRRSTALQRSLLTPTVLTLAQAAYEERAEVGALDPDRLAVLADALEEAGCPQTITCPYCDGTCGFQANSTWVPCEWCDPEYPEKPTTTQPGLLPHPLLAHLRSKGPHVRGCHALDCILGRE